MKLKLKYKNPNKYPLMAGDLIVGKSGWWGNGKVAIVFGSCFNDYSVIWLNNKKPEIIGFPWDDCESMWTIIGKIHNIDLDVKKLGKGYDLESINCYGFKECLTKE